MLGEIQSWRLCFLVIGIPGLILTLLVTTVREPPRLDKTDPLSIGASASFTDAIAYIARHGHAFATLFVASGCTVTMSALAFWNIAVFKRSWDWNVAEVGLAVGLILFIGLLINVPGCVLFCAQIGQSMSTAAGPASLVMLAPAKCAPN